MQAALNRWFGLRGEDARKLFTMLPVFYFGGVAESLNYTAFMALFNQRFGVQFLPYVYIAEAVIMPVEGWLLAKLAGRTAKDRFMRILYLIMLFILIGNGAVLLAFMAGGFDFRYYYPILFVSSNFVVRQLTLLLWSTAFDLCPTQQAKRLMPVFVASTTTGGITAGIGAYLIGKWFGTVAVYALAPVMLLIGYGFFRKSLARYLTPLMIKEAARKQEAPETVRQDERTNRYYMKQIVASPFLLTAIGLMTLMPTLYFMMEYQYFNVAEAHFTNEGDLTAFYGLITALQFTLCLGLQTVSGKLMNKLGASNVLLGISLLFAGGFGLVSVSMNGPYGLGVISFSYAVLYILLYYIAEPCYQLFFKMMPISERDGFRYYAQGLAASGGILIGSFLSMTHSMSWLGLAPLAWIGIALSLVLIVVAWYGRHLYIRELVGSVQSLFADLSENAVSFLGAMNSSKSLSAILGYLKHPNDYVRELALELIGKVKDSTFFPHLIGLTGDGSARIRFAALRAMNLQTASLQELVQVAAFLEDPDEEVRAECVKLLGRAKHMKSQAHFFLRAKLLDAQPRVVHEGIKALYALESEESYPACEETLVSMLDKGGEWAIYGCRTVADLKLTSYAPWLMTLLEDPKPAVRAAAIHGLGKLGYTEAAPALLAMIPLADKEIRKAILDAFIDINQPAVPVLLEHAAGGNPFIWNLSVTALAYILDEKTIRQDLIDLCIQRITTSSREGALPEALDRLGKPELSELAAQRVIEIHLSLLEGVWAVLAQLSDERVVLSLQDTIRDDNEEVRENGMEVLAEGIGDRRLSGALLDFLKRMEHADDSGSGHPRALIEDARTWPDEWLSRIAAHAVEEGERSAVKEERKMLSMLDKVIFLKQVSLFSDLSVDELGHLAGISQEEVHPEGAILLRRGEPSPSLYIVIEGTVELSNGLEGVSGGTIGVISSKQSLGETSALDGAASSVTAQVIFDDALLLAMHGAQLSRLIRLYPEIGIGLLHATSARVRLLENMLMKMA
ncbi:HEAT repeat domain-containing protein [Paenibacillus sp. GCM10012303]|uniref:HEAT repeat domain-containing protein n=1 Tax=Paenibacillus sp. GCM10012303 TaxID=3317340 RepID=UPI0036214119